MPKNKGFAGMNFQQIMMQQAQQSVDKPVYCRFCGKNVKEPTNKSPGGANGGWMRYLDWEIENSCHVSCANEQRTGGRR